MHLYKPQYIIFPHTSENFGVPLAPRPRMTPLTTFWLVFIVPGFQSIKFRFSHFPHFGIQHCSILFILAAH
jgi:hypothetical protein